MLCILAHNRMIIKMKIILMLMLIYWIISSLYSKLMELIKILGIINISIYNMMHIYNNYKIISSVVMLLGECKDKEMVNKCMESKEGIIDVYHGNNI